MAVKKLECKIVTQKIRVEDGKELTVRICETHSTIPDVFGKRDDGAWARFIAGQKECKL